ncbi:hypothetical protein AWR38_07240 [Idiomarina sp. WRN-38]|uniref:gluconeogenesis factor YvcK family protein n=1 Tax=Idiomarina sp. OXR-189 TaxID=3100175 RepID=UPI00073398EB|nr:uridine diphosphate-N-acetylglucosamine-binding protein YvcK [Idiomarina sp. OXR-189]KTG23805.1 hypothetical protein AUR68_07225 [Idiomarina sp. H105]OAE91196.1 hypothetical protein AWR38_07240 [Idiomarina sp. WRN-38]WPZ02481.1 uridine diphosphate-N-acetylglucosamine-binding protein YvcK [Idiomarina sp. OXR-189]
MQLQSLRCITAIGGGHGLGRVLSTLSFMKHKLVGIVATTDNGGATGLLRASQHCIAWGDIRNCLSQLVEQPLAAEVLNYRFDSDSALKGHNFGNLLLYTLDQLSARPLDGIQLLSRLLNVDNRILPMSECPTDLIATTSDGIQCHGEIHIDKLPNMPHKLELSGQVEATPEAVRHIKNSQLILIGPGSFMTSVMPPLLVPGICDALKSTRAKVVFIDNLVDEHGPAGELSLAEKLEFMKYELGQQVVDLILSNKKEKGVPVPVIGGLTSDTDVHYRHNTSSLLTTLEQAAHQLLVESA